MTGKFKLTYKNEDGFVYEQGYETYKEAKAAALAMNIMSSHYCKVISVCGSYSISEE